MKKTKCFISSRYHSRTRIVGGDTHPRCHMDCTHTTCRPDDSRLPSVTPALEVSDCTGFSALIQNLYKIDLLLGGSDCVVMPVDSNGVLVGINIVDGIPPWTSGRLYPRLLRQWGCFCVDVIKSEACLNQFLANNLTQSNQLDKRGTLHFLARYQLSCVKMWSFKVSK